MIVPLFVAVPPSIATSPNNSVLIVPLFIAVPFPSTYIEKCWFSINPFSPFTIVPSTAFIPIPIGSPILPSVRLNEPLAVIIPLFVAVPPATYTPTPPFVSKDLSPSPSNPFPWILIVPLFVNVPDVWYTPYPSPVFTVSPLSPISVSIEPCISIVPLFSAIPPLFTIPATTLSYCQSGEIPVPLFTAVTSEVTVTVTPLFITIFLSFSTVNAVSVVFLFSVTVVVFSGGVIGLLGSIGIQGIEGFLSEINFPIFSTVLLSELPKFPFKINNTSVFSSSFSINLLSAE